ncbi:MAG TPA: HD domain-containing protein [Kofleriaceae bacterium]|nr:HD domain-containing protein [Kofleriaceae bacterium]
MLFSPDRYVEALQFAARRHEGQVVPGSGLPYLVHVVSVAAETIAAIEVDRALLDDPDLAVLCALLHDTVEDTADTAEARAELVAELARRFDHGVAAGVLALSKDDRLPKPERTADSLRRIRAQPREVWMVKLADRVTNLAPPPAAWPREKRIAYRDEALVIADALGDASPMLHARLRARIQGYARHFGS